MQDFLLTIFANLDVSELPRVQATSQRLETLVQTVLMIMGAVAVLILAISGFRMINSRGSSSDVAKARDGVIYSVVGLVIIIFAFAIVGFVANSVAG